MRHDPNLYGYDVFYVFTYIYVYIMYKNTISWLTTFYISYVVPISIYFYLLVPQTIVLVPDQLKIRFETLIIFQGLLLCFGQHREGPPGLQVDQDPAVLLRD